MATRVQKVIRLVLEPHQAVDEPNQQRKDHQRTEESTQKRTGIHTALNQGDFQEDHQLIALKFQETSYQIDLEE